MAKTNLENEQRGEVMLDAIIEGLKSAKKDESEMTLEELVDSGKISDKEYERRLKEEGE